MTKRRSEGTGSLVERPPGSGRWRFSIRLGLDPVTGKPRRITRTVTAKSEKAAAAKARAIIAELEATDVTGDQITMAQLFDLWLEHLAASNRSPTYLASSRRFVSSTLNPALGPIKVGELTALHLDRLYAKWLREGKKPSTVRRHHALISSALSRAVKWDVVARNVADNAEPPIVEQDELVPPTRDEIQRISDLAEQRGRHHSMAIALAATTGARRGELCALRWSDFEDGTLWIREAAVRVGGETVMKSTKTRSKRVIYMTPQTQAALEAWRREREEVAAGAGVELLPDAFILSAWPDQSQPLNPDTITTTFTRCAREAGLEHVHFHSLRHYVGSEAMAVSGPADAAKRLGHADSRMVHEVYGHSEDGRQRALAQALDGIGPNFPGQSVE